MANWTESLVGKKRGNWRPAQDFLRRRLSEAAGLALFIAALLLLVMLASYDPKDPSLNHAENALVHNWIGPLGANIADLLYQTCGLVALLLPLVLFAWSFRLLLNRGIEMLWLRLVLMPPAVLLGAVAVAVLPTPGWWFLPRVGFGGIFGDFLLGTATHGGVVPLPIAGMIAAALAGALLLYILGLSWRDWRDIGEGAGRLASAAGRMTAIVVASGARVVAWIRALRPPAKPETAKIVPTKPARREPMLDELREEAPEIERPPRRALPPDLVAPKAPGTAPGKRGTAQRQQTLALDPEDEHVLPPLDLLAAPPPGRASATVNEEALQQNARLLETVLEDFGVRGQIVRCAPARW